jgi:uncharacterized membrane protein YgdD (TMEM256/DUF423 family)
MDRLWLALGSLSMFLAVAAGAFGRHALRGRLPADMLEVFEVAARYQVYHALALIAVSLLAGRGGGAGVGIAGWAFAAGTVVFCGSLYLLAFTGQRWLGAITPLGGVLFLAGWLALFYSAIGSLRRG